MSERVFEQSVRIPAPAAEVFAWHERPGAFERLSPPWEPARVVARSGSIHDGDRIEISMPLGPLRQRWVAEHRDYVAGRQFRDVQLAGPFAKWEHTHSVAPDGPDASNLTDRIVYRLPFGPVGDLLGRRLARGKLQRVFDYRHRVMLGDFASHGRHSGAPRMRILISGSTGLVGSALSSFLTTGGHTVTGLSRSRSTSAEPTITWDPAGGQLDAAQLEGFDAVIHLAGESIASGRWTAAQKKRIRDSRVAGTRLLSERLASLKSPPRVFVCASAIGYYGDRGDETLTEASAPGTNFLADVCVEWEAAAQAARAKGIRVTHARFGVILSPLGGALKQMLTPFKLGVGGKIGSGRQYMSWIALDDVVGALFHVLMQPELSGPVNFVAPHPVTNAEFTRVLGRVLSRPTIFPVPAFAAKLAFGQMADELLLASTRVLPEKLSDYEFRYPDLEAALRHVLGKTGPVS